MEFGFYMMFTQCVRRGDRLQLQLRLQLYRPVSYELNMTAWFRAIVRVTVALIIQIETNHID